MAEYYVVRDKNTGLYFRGKGVNRWGKYYNQASIYRIKANAENTIKEVSWRGEQAEIVPIQIVETTEDVVLRGHLDQVRWERDVAIEQLEEIGLSFGEKTDGYGNLTEYVREIFEEIETTLKLYKKYDFRSGTYFECYLEAGIAELKKKYTESEDKE